VPKERVEQEKEKLARAMNEYSVSKSRAGEKIFRYWLRCGDSLERREKMYQKRREKPGPPPRAGNGAGLSGPRPPHRGDATALAESGAHPPGPAFSRMGEEVLFYAWGRALGIAPVGRGGHLPESRPARLSAAARLSV
jgi:hypothetical protein